MRMVNVDMVTVDKLVTKADELFRDMDGEVWGNPEVEAMVDNNMELLDQMIAFFEGIGGKVDGVQYLDGRHKK